MFKSPIWAEKLYFTGTYYDDQRNPIPSASTFQLNLPMTLSAGISYDGFRNTVVGMDVRYLDYDNAAGLNKGVVNGVVEGLDWESVFAISIGAERRINNRIKARMGYAWNENPIPGRSAALCISAPMITQHVFSCGLRYAIAKDMELAAAYTHAFEAEHTGTILGQPGTSISNILSANTLYANIVKKW
jgi:long-subunit fatty acid transport protein